MRQNEFAEAIGFLKQGHAGDDEHIDTRTAIVVDTGKNLLWTSDERSPRTVVNELPDPLPVTTAEIEALERYFGEVLDEVFDPNDAKSAEIKSKP